MCSTIMKINLLKTTKIICITLLAFALLAVPFQVRNVRLVKAQNTAFQFTKVTGVYFKQLAYHQEMNAFFNKKIKALTSKQGVLTPADGKNCKDNVTTYCVAEEATEMFFKYKEVLIAEKSNLKEETARAQASGSGFQQILVEMNSQKAAGIEAELIAAEKTLDMTIEAYNELQIAYPLHVQYQEMINNLETYRYQLESIQSLTSNFPKVFVNATTTACT